MEHSKLLILVVAVIYTLIGIGQLLQGSWSGFTIWIAYAVANLGLYAQAS